MYKQLFIASFFYLAGAALCLAFVHSDLAEDKSFVLTFDEDSSEEGQKLDEFLKTLSEFKSQNLPSGFAIFLKKSSFLTHWLIPFNEQGPQGKKAVQAPLFLLYHALIFYDLH